MSDAPTFARVFNEVHGADNAAHKDKPHGWVQWKGTDVCIDLHCPCGYHGHVDATFFYTYRCHGCKKVYAVGMNVALIEITPEQQAALGHEPHVDACDGDEE